MLVSDFCSFLAISAIDRLYEMAAHVLDDYYLAITAIITAGYQLCFFAIAYTCKFDKLTGKFFIISLYLTYTHRCMSFW
jgi:hypothetical protein